MRNEIMKDKKVALIAALCLCAFVGLAYWLTRALFEPPDGEKAGILNPESGIVAPAITEDDRVDAYHKRPVFPPASELKLDERALTYLSTSDFDGLDAWLQQLSNTYRDGTEEESDDSQIRYSSLIERYRADAALMEAILSGDAGYEPVARFQTPDVLAAAIVYAPISAKYSAFINQDALILPPVNSAHAGDTGLERKALSVQRQLELIGEYSARMSDERYDEVYEYAFRAHGLPLVLHIVHTRENLYLPYSLQISDTETASRAGACAAGWVTVKDIRQMQETAKASGLTFDPDSVIAISDGTESEDTGEEVPAFQMPEGFQPLTEPLDFQTRPGA